MGFAYEKFTICKTHAKKFNGPKNAPYAKPMPIKIWAEKYPIHR